MLADITDYLSKREEHIRGVAPLHLFPIDADQQVQGLGVQFRLNPGSYRGEGVGALGPPEGPVVLLPGTLADVIATSVAKDILGGSFLGNAAARFANNRHRLALVVDFTGGVSGNDNGIVYTGQGVSSLAPGLGTLGNGHGSLAKNRTGILKVVNEVKTRPPQLGGVCRRQQLHIGQ